MTGALTACQKAYFVWTGFSIAFFGAQPSGFDVFISLS